MIVVIERIIDQGREVWILKVVKVIMYVSKQLRYRRVFYISICVWGVFFGLLEISSVFLWEDQIL